MDGKRQEKITTWHNEGVKANNIKIDVVVAKKLDDKGVDNHNVKDSEEMELEHW